MCIVEMWRSQVDLKADFAEQLCHTIISNNYYTCTDYTSTGANARYVRATPVQT